MKKLSLVILIGLVSLAYSVTFTSPGGLTGTPWNDGASWGHTSPGTKGTDWPGLAGDVVTISATDSIVYNVSETNNLGAVTVNGALRVDTSVNCLITMGNVSFTIGSTGRFYSGKTTAPFPKAHTFEMVFNTSGDNAQGFTVTDGGKYSICGDTTYCSSYVSTLANNAENTNNDSIIITNNDMSAIWHVGDKLTIERSDSGYINSSVNDIYAANIIALTGTTIAISKKLTSVKTGVGSTWIGHINNLTRNIKIYKYGYFDTTGANNTNRPFFIDNTTANPNTNVIQGCKLGGLYRITINNCANLRQNVFRNGNNVLSSGSNNTLTTCNLYSNYYVFSSGSNNNTFTTCNLYSNNNVLSGSSNNTLTTCNLYSNNYVLSSGNNNTLTTCNLYSNNYVLSSGNNSTLTTCNLYSNYYVLSSGSNNNTLTNCMIGYDTLASSKPNIYDWRTNQLNYLTNCKMPAAGLVYYDRNIAGNMFRVECAHYNQVLNAARVFECFGDIIKTPCDGTGTSPSVDPDGVHGDCVEISNLQSLCSSSNYIPVFNYKQYRIWATASVSKTYTFKIQSTFTATLANTEIRLSGTYLDSTTNGHMVTTNSTATVAARASASDWTQTISVTINPASDGWVDLQIYIMKYESGKKVYIWPKCTIS